MADKDSEREENSEPLSATAMFLRSFATEAQSPEVTPEPVPAKTVAETPRAEAGEFTRMFRPMPPVEPTSVPPPPDPPSRPATALNPSGDGEFTRAFIVPTSITEQPSASSTSSSKGKGFSTPGVSGSASAEGSFTRILKTAPPPQAVEPQSAVPLTPRVEVPTQSPDPVFSPPPPSTVPSSQGSGVTELFRALSPSQERYPPESAYRPEPAPVPRPYAEPIRIAGPERPADVMPPGGGVTALLNRLTAETPLMPSEPGPLPVQRHTSPSTIPFAAPGDTRGEFTRIIQAAEVQAALAPASPPPPAPVSSMPVPAPPAFPMPAPAITPPAPPVAAAPVLPSLAAPALPKLKIEAPAVPPPAKSKLQEMVPLLLVANAFLMMILILLVAFALHRK